MITKMSQEEVAELLSKRKKKQIQKSALGNRVMRLSYVDSKGNKSSRLVEPYKLTDSDLWAFDVDKDSIRRFKTKNILGAKRTFKKFEPRWSISV